MTATNKRLKEFKIFIIIFCLKEFLWIVGIKRKREKKNAAKKCDRLLDIDRFRVKQPETDE